MNTVFSNVWEWYGFSGDDNADKIISEVDSNVALLVDNHILKEKPTTLIQVGRKGSHLISQHKRRIEEKGFNTCQYNILKLSPLHFSRPIVPSNSKAIVVTDTIHRGKETIGTINTLRGKKVTVEKIFCYLKNEEGVQNLINTGIITRDKVVSLFSSNSEEEYEKASRQLAVFFRSRIEPMDPDLCFNMYDLNTVVKPKYFKDILTPIMSDFFESNVHSEVSQRKGLASNVAEVAFSIGSNSNREEIVQNLLQENLRWRIQDLKILSKIISKSNHNEFTTIVKLSAHGNIQEKTKSGECFKRPAECLMSTTKYNKSKKYEVMKYVCPDCIHSLLSGLILDKLNEGIIDSFRRKGSSCRLTWLYRPAQ